VNLSRVVADGPVRRVLWAGTPSGRCPGQEYFMSLPDPEPAKAEALFRRMAEQVRIVNEQHFRHEGDGAAGGQALRQPVDTRGPHPMDDPTP